jgi:uncharacterized protein (UPF0276 family)
MIDLGSISNELKKTCGVSLRAPHFSDYESGSNVFEAIEVLTENYLFTKGERREIFNRISASRLIHFHGVSLNIGSPDPLDSDFLKRLAEFTKPHPLKIISDHLCFTSIEGQNSFDLLPVPKTLKMASYVSDRFKSVSDVLGEEIALENISTYFNFHVDHFSEIDFINLLTDRFGVKLLLDVNNLFVSSQNLGFNPFDYLEAIPANSVVGYHVGGFEMVDEFHFDTHGAPVILEVKNLYKVAVQRFGHKPTFLERDENIPPTLGELEQELVGILQ